MRTAPRFSRLPVGFGDDLQHLPIEARLVAYEVATTRLRTTIPGLVHVGVAGFAEACGLELEVVQRALDALQGIVQRDPARPLLFMPRCIQVDPPANPNVLKAWSAAIDELPGCGLIALVEDTIAGTLTSETMRDTWNGLRNGSGNGSGNGMSNPIPIPTPVPIPSTDPNTNTHTVSDALAERFERVWAVYPKKQGRQEAQSTFEALNPTEAFTGTILTAIRAHSASAQWQADGHRYVPKLAGWLMRGGWEDEAGPPLYEDGVPLAERCESCGELHGLLEDCLPLCDDCHSRHRDTCHLARMRHARESVDAADAEAAAAAGVGVEEYRRQMQDATWTRLRERFGTPAAVAGGSREPR